MIITKRILIQFNSTFIDSIVNNTESNNDMSKFKEYVRDRYNLDYLKQLSEESIRQRLPR